MLHRRQFVLARESLQPAPNWQIRAVGGFCLSHCPELPVAEISDLSGRRWWLIGVAVNGHPDLPPPEVELAQFNGDDVASLYQNWCGRWILMDEHTLHLDAGGTLGVYYTQPVDGHGLAVSSSFTLLRRFWCPDEPAEFVLRHKVAMDWAPAPGTRCGSIRRLLPTQSLLLQALNGNEPGPIPRSFLIEKPGEVSLDQVCAEMCTYLTTVVRRIGERFSTIYIPLTGGRDSRLVLAATLHEHLPIVAYTQHIGLLQHGRVISRADAITPDRICREIGVPYRYIRPRAENVAMRNEYDIHTAGHANDADRDFYTRGQWDGFAADAVILRGGAYEIGRCILWSKLATVQWDAPDAAARILQSYRVEAVAPGYAALHRHISSWLEWCRNHPVPGLDMRDRFFLDQRVGAWLGALEQALDLTDCTRIHIASSHRYFALVLSLPATVRQQGLHQDEVLRRLAPELARWPVNRKHLADYAAKLAGMVFRAFAPGFISKELSMDIDGGQ